MAEGGWLKLYRELIEKPIWKCTTPEQKAILITLLCMANHEENEWIWKGEKYKCQPGQFITSLKSIAEKSGTSIKNVRTALKNFEQIYEFLASKSTNRNRLVTITNWELYQSKKGKVASKRASNGQASGKQVATNKNDKNDKNDKEDINNEQNEFFESIWKLYPNKKGKGQVSKTQISKLYKIGFETLEKCIERYRRTKEDWKAWQQGSTFFNSGYIDYLDENYAEQEEGGPKYADLTGIGLGQQ